MPRTIGCSRVPAHSVIAWPRVDPFRVVWSVATVTRDYDLMDRVGRITSKYPRDHVGTMRNAADYMEDMWLRRLLSSCPAAGALSIAFG